MLGFIFVGIAATFGVDMIGGAIVGCFGVELFSLLSGVVLCDVLTGAYLLPTVGEDHTQNWFAAHSELIVSAWIPLTIVFSLVSFLKNRADGEVETGVGIFVATWVVSMLNLLLFAQVGPSGNLDPEVARQYGFNGIAPGSREVDRAVKHTVLQGSSWLWGLVAIGIILALAALVKLAQVIASED